MIFLRSANIKKASKETGAFPFNLPFIQNFEPLEFKTPITLFVGENGTGKSTLLESLAAKIGSITIGQQNIQTDPTLANARMLADKLQLSWTKKTGRGFFMRAEDVFNYTRSMNELGKDLEDTAASYEKTLTGYGLQLAKGAVLGQRNAMEKRYGKDLDANSHGEIFLKLFQSRFVPDGLYLIDEPEAPLSPLRQLSLISLIRQYVTEGAQFIIATHSPILMALPEATLLSFDSYPIKAVAYEDLQNVSLLKDFLNNPETFLRRL